MTRIAQCHCGEVKLTCEGEPDPVIMCSCELCQRRTGAPLQTSGWFDGDKVIFEGKTKAFSRTSGDKGLFITYNFCPECGTTMWWPGPEGGALEGLIGVAGGCFADASFPQPTVALYDKRRHPWITTPKDIPCFEESFGDPHQD